MTEATPEKPRLGKVGLTFFLVVMALGLAFQTFIEMAMKGLGYGSAPATNAFASLPMAALPTVALLFFGLIYPKGLRLTLRAVGYAVSLHGLLCGWLWVTLSEPVQDIYDIFRFDWLNEHPDLAGLWLMLGSGAVWLALFATSPALPPELKRLRGFP